MSSIEHLRSPAELVAIARAAHIVGDRDLERAARNELREAFGIEIRFPRPARPKAEAVPCK
jgi:hypothetical protein